MSIHFRASVLSLLSLLAAASLARAQSLSIDNFEEYANNTTVASSSTSTPWDISGTADNGSFISTTNSTAVLDGTSSGDAPVTWATATNSLNLRYVFSSATNISSYAIATVDVRAMTYSSGAYHANTSTTAQLQLVLEDSDGTTYQTNVPVALSGTTQTLTFTISSSAMGRTSSETDPFATLLTEVTQAGFRISNSSSSPSPTTEHIIIDDFALQSAPEPGSAALISLGASGLLLRRRAPRRCPID